MHKKATTPALATPRQHFIAFLRHIGYILSMAITRGAKKAHRQSLRKKSMNIGRKLAIRAGVKGVRAVKEAGTATGKEGVAALATAYKAIDKALKRGVIKKNTAARRKAGVAKLLTTKK